MSVRSSTPELGKELDAKAVAQLNRIFGSKAFRQADRLKRFLTFIVEETLAGRGERLKEFVVGVEVFGKDNSFDPRNDPIVRVQARRLRSQLAAYYHEEGAHDDLMIELPKGGYAPVFRPLKAAAKRTISPILISRNTVLVRPFSQYSQTGEGSGYFSEGLIEELIHTLAGLEGIRLVARNDNTKADSAIGAEYSNAALVLTGSVRQAGNRARITAN